jgi:iron complex transport system substrate-binding protein
MRLAWALLVWAALLLCPPQGDAASLVFRDDSGQRIEVKKPFTRIISLYGAHTENLFSLGLDRQIIGVPPKQTYPPPALNKPVFSYRDDPERFLAARPDLVLIRPMIYRSRRNLVSRLREYGVTLVSLQPRSIQGMFKYWLRLGQLTGRQVQAQKMIEEFKRRLAAFRARTARVPDQQRPRVYFEAIHSKMKTFAPESMAIFVLRAAGGVNLAADARSLRGTNIAAYGKERILAKGEDMDVYLAQQGTMNPVTVSDIRRESGFAAIKAVRRGRVHLVDEKLVSRPTLRLLAGIEAIQAVLYPGGLLETRR